MKPTSVHDIFIISFFVFSHLVRGVRINAASAPEWSIGYLIMKFITLFWVVSLCTALLNTAFICSWRTAEVECIRLKDQRTAVTLFKYPVRCASTLHMLCGTNLLIFITCSSSLVVYLGLKVMWPGTPLISIYLLVRDGRRWSKIKRPR